MPGVLLLDGGLGTSLQYKYGIKFGPSTPLWSSDLLVTDQNTLLSCQRDFGSVPVDIILTATYQLSKEGFAKTLSLRSGSEHAGDHDEQASLVTLMDDAVTIAQKAKHPNASVALSIGPYGACMVPSEEYSGRYDEAHNSAASLEEWHRERLEVFAQIPNLRSRVAYVAIETVPRVDEMIAIRKALSSVAQLRDLPFWMSCLYPGDEDQCPDGHSPEEAVRAMLDTAVTKTIPWGIGINCTTVWKLESLLKKYEAAVMALFDDGKLHQWPALVLYPDGTNGEIYNTTTQKWELPMQDPGRDRRPWEEQLADVVRNAKERGRWSTIVVGGCCMSNAEHITRLRNILLS